MRDLVEAIELLVKLRMQCANIKIAWNTLRNAEMYLQDQLHEYFKEEENV